MNTRLVINHQIAELILSKPEKHNAFDDVMIQDLRTQLDRVRTDPSLRALVLRAEGKHFCAGADLSWMKRMASHNEDENLQDARQLAGLMADLYHLSIPTIAVVQGAAYGGAIGLIACCDIAMATDDARFCLSEVKLGLAPATIGPYVVAAMGPRRCNQLFMTACVFNAKQAEAYGLLHEIYPSDVLEDELNATLKQILKAGPMAVKSAKALIRSCIPPFDSQLAETTSQMIARLRVSEEGQEGLHAFFEKRSPNWAVEGIDS